MYSYLSIEWVPHFGFRYQETTIANTLKTCAVKLLIHKVSPQFVSSKAYWLYVLHQMEAHRFPISNPCSLIMTSLEHQLKRHDKWEMWLGTWTCRHPRTNQQLCWKLYPYHFLASRAPIAPSCLGQQSGSQRKTKYLCHHQRAYCREQWGGSMANVYTITMICYLGRTFWSKKCSPTNYISLTSDAHGTILSYQQQLPKLT